MTGEPKEVDADEGILGFQRKDGALGPRIDNYRGAVERAVTEACKHSTPTLNEMTRGRDDAGLDEALPNIVDGKGRGMEHVDSVKTVVAQFVEENLESGEVADDVALGTALKPVDAKEEDGFAESAAVEAVLGVTVRTDGKQNAQIGGKTAKTGYGGSKEGGAGVGGKLLLGKKGRGHLMAIGDGTGGAGNGESAGRKGTKGVGVKIVGVIGAERED